MNYDPQHTNVLASVTYGSKLYGTSTPTSDDDFKTVYLPSKKNMMLGKPLKVLKFRFDASGKPIGDDSLSMPDNGYEAEHTPVQKFVNDWLGGQAYAVETVFAVLQGYADAHYGNEHKSKFVELCEVLVKDFRIKNLQGMTGFAQKQVFDYIRRGERLNFAKAVLKEIHFMQDEFFKEAKGPRLDTKYKDKFVLDYIADSTGLKIGQSTSQNSVMRTLELNGRQYLDTTTLVDLERAVQKLVDQYGERSTKASETDVDWKSLSHALRVYQQVIELLETGTIVFPRHNSEFLLSVKQGHVPLEDVKNILRELDDEVTLKLEASTLPDSTQELKSKLDVVMYDWLEQVY